MSAAALRRKRGTVRGSITRIKSRVADLKTREEVTEVPANARQLGRKLESLASEFRELHYSVLDAIDSEEDSAREQRVFEEVDDEITQLQIDIEALASLTLPSDSLVTMKDKRKTISRKLLHMRRNLDLIARAIDSEELDPHTVAEWATELSKYKRDLQDAHEQILALDLDEADDVCETHSALEQITFELSLKANKIRGRDAIDLESIKHTHEGVRLPKLEVPRFDGDILQWRVFWEQFNISVHSRSNLSKAEKLVYLQQSLKEGSAKGIVEGLSKSGDCYDEAVECLTARYNRPRLIHQTHVKRIMDVPSLKFGTGKELRYLYDTVQQHLRALKAMGYDPPGAFITSMLELKLDTSTSFEWQRHSQGKTDVPHHNELLEFINLRAQASESVLDHSQKKPKNDLHPKGSKTVSGKHISYTVAVSKSGDNCCACKCDKHPLYTCPKFRALSHNNKMSLLKTHGLCHNCLKPGHYANQCKSISRCRVCQRPHHSLLHLEAKPDTPIVDPPPNVASNLVTSHAATEPNSNVLLMTCKVLIKSPDGSNFEIRGILDSASSTSFVSERIVQTLKLPRYHYNTKVIGIAGLSHPTTNQSVVEISISPVHLPNQIMNLSAIVVPRITCDLPVSPIVSVPKWDHLSALHLADPTFGSPGRIDILLGVDIFTSVLLRGRRLGPPGTPAAIKTKFGWVLAGSVKAPMDIPSNPIVTCLSITESIDDMLHRFWEVETVPSPDLTLTPEERLVLKHFKENYSRTENGTFVVPLPRRVDHPPLGESRSRAVKRFLSLERSLGSQRQQEEFHDVMEEYFRLNHAEVVPECDLDKAPENVFYLPMHAVYKDSSTTTKLRIVFDASAKTSSGVSLNDTLMVGPTVHPPLIDVLLQFRLHRIAMVADISKMYRAIGLANSDKDLHRFVWRRSPDHPLKDYRMKRLTFGVSASSFAANMAVKQNAVDLFDDYPLAAAVVSSSFYVDDGLLGADSVESASELVRQSHELFSKGGFLLRKWNSSNPSVLKALPDGLKSAQATSRIICDATQYTKTLGVEWHSVMDHFRLSVSELSPIVNLTKRALVSDVAKTYDILGWFSPTIITMKILLQRTWEAGIGWDDVVPVNIRDRWSSWRTELSCLTTKHIPRCYFPKDRNILCKQLHGFSDASENAYAAVVYFRSTDKAGDVHISLVTAKTKVAPIKRLTIPRLELCGAQLLAHLLYHLKELFDMHHDAIYAWTDSTIVLDWLSSNSRQFKTFVGNRISDIVDHIPPDRWNHVNGSSNPADCASRGILPSELLQHNLWWDGPDWLRGDPSTWPKGKPLSVERVDSEERSICFVTSVVIHSPIMTVDHYSSFSKLKRVTGWVHRFICNVSTAVSNRLTRPFLSVDELMWAEGYWLRMVQIQYFPKEIEYMKAGKPLPSSSSLLALCPILDDNDIIRVGGRQGNSSRPYESNHPIILHGSHIITRMIIREEHVRLMHGGPTLVHGSVSRRYHVIGGHRVFRSIIRKCVTCRKYSAKTQTQKMGDLPTERVKPDHPFSNVGVDYAGPFYTKQGHTRKPTIVKSYVCVFVALSIKAVHLELVSDLTSEAFIAALRRFTARRGKPSLITSDNGTNFVKANKDLSELSNFLQDQVVQKNISEFCSYYGIRWKFIPERAPHFGGLWESAVRSMKYHLKRVIGDVRLTFEELTTLLAQIEACLNSRPLTPLTADEEGIEVLTPGHFLVGRPLEALPDFMESHSPISLLRRWHLVQNLNRQFWERWSDEYLTTIRKSTKWQYPSRNIQVNDVVLIKEDGLVPTKWPMARVTTTHEGNDKRVRVATVKTANGTYKRPITKLVLLLPTEDDASSIHDSSSPDSP